MLEAGRFPRVGVDHKALYLDEEGPNGMVLPGQGCEDVVAMGFLELKVFLPRESVWGVRGCVKERMCVGGWV